MFRFRLALVIIVSFSFVLFLGVALYWTSNQVGWYFQRSQAAYQAFDHYERLSQEAYRHFKQRMDRLIISTPTAAVGVELSKQRLYQAMQDLRNTAVNSPIKEGQIPDGMDKPAELERIAHFTAFLDASEYRFDDIERLREQGKMELAMQALSKFSEEEIDGKFQPLIDTAINAEREKAEKAKQEMENLVRQSRWVAILASLTAALFSLASGAFLLRGVKKPVEALMKGTDEIASGNFDYRIVVDSGDEFAYLASHFNQMANELDAQHNKLRQARIALEKRVAERTFELHRLNDELKRMDAARREFLADISHELRTPITVIRGEAEVTLRGKDREIVEYKEALRRIVELAMQLGTYVKDLLSLARAETANVQFDWVSLDLAELLTCSTEDFRMMAEENGHLVSLKVSGKPIWVYGDKQRLRQLLFILGDNACRYSKPQGEVTITLWQDASQAYFSVADQGIGIPAQDLERIFDRRFRSQNALNLHDDGTGLGLPMAKSILKAHGGEITVLSTEGLGSTFTVTLPLVLVASDG